MKTLFSLLLMATMICLTPIAHADEAGDGGGGGDRKEASSKGGSGSGSGADSQENPDTKNLTQNQIEDAKVNPSIWETGSGKNDVNVLNGCLACKNAALASGSFQGACSPGDDPCTSSCIVPPSACLPSRDVNLRRTKTDK